MNNQTLTPAGKTIVGVQFLFVAFGSTVLVQSIPTAVLGGIMLLLFGSIASVGVKNLINNKVDFKQTRNIIIVSVMLTMGIGGAVLSFGSFSMSGTGLSAIVGVLLNLLLPASKEE